MVDLGLTAMTVVGTVVPEPLYTQPTSTPVGGAEQEGRLGLICCLSISGVPGVMDVGMVM